MTDVHDTRIEVPSLCPVCYGDMDPREYAPQYCGLHQPAREGVEDEAVPAVENPVYPQDGSGGEDNRRWCALIHRKQA